jgi:hypothetical protein
MTDLDVMLFSVEDFRENWRSEGRTFLAGVNEIVFLVIPWYRTILWT